MCIQVLRIYRFYRKNRRLQWSLPSLQTGILAAFLLLAYLIARLDSLDGKRRRFIRQFRLVCLWDGVPPL
jgi:hypothetical protein